MFQDIENARVLNMTDQERRWLDNVKKAIYESALVAQSRSPENRCLEELFKGIDTAKTLRRSLRGEFASKENNRDRFIEFLALELPVTGPNAFKVELKMHESGKIKLYTLPEILYAIRCKIHENENLDVREAIAYPSGLTGRG